MSVYVSSDDLPFYFQIDGAELAAVRAMVREWMGRPLIFSVDTSEIDAADVPDVLAGMTINFGALRLVTITETPVSGKASLRMDYVETHDG